MPQHTDNHILKIEGLKVTFKPPGKPEKEAVKGISLQIEKGQSYALVGESGSGKSVTCSAILGLLPSSASISGKIFFNGKDLLQNPKELKQIRGRQIGYIPQNPITSLNPVRSVYSQLKETIESYKPNLSEKEMTELMHKALLDVQLNDHKKVLSSYPFELSGGMCQRVMIALALLGDPLLLLADEPTTALDVTIQAEIMTLLLETIKKRGLSLLLITHDLALVAQSCQQVSVIRNGEICESGPVAETYAQPKHPYTSSLIESVKL